MPKIKVKAMLHNITENKYFSNEVNGILDDKKIKFIDDDIIVVLDLKDDVCLYRKGKEYNIYIPFKLNEKTIGIYDVNGIGRLEVEVNTSKIDIQVQNIEIEYSIYGEGQDKQEFNYKVEYEEM